MSEKIQQQINIITDPDQNRETKSRSIQELQEQAKANYEKTKEGMAGLTGNKLNALRNEIEVGHTELQKNRQEYIEADLEAESMELDALQNMINEAEKEGKQDPEKSVKEIPFSKLDMGGKITYVIAKIAEGFEMLKDALRGLGGEALEGLAKFLTMLGYHKGADFLRGIAHEEHTVLNDLLKSNDPPLSLIADPESGGKGRDTQALEILRNAYMKEIETKKEDIKKKTPVAAEPTEAAATGAEAAAAPAATTTPATAPEKKPAAPTAEEIDAKAAAEARAEYPFTSFVTTRIRPTLRKLELDESLKNEKGYGVTLTEVLKAAELMQ